MIGPAARRLAAVGSVVLALAGPGAGAGSAQEPPSDDRAAVVATVRSFFEALSAEDTAALRAAFHPEASLASVTDEDGDGVVGRTDVDDFLRSVGGASADLHEAVGEPEVRIDGPLATVWVPYTFYVDGSPSHCGVNALDLARTDGAWSVLHVTDTRRRGDCGPP